MKAALIGVGQAGGKLVDELIAHDRAAGHGAIRGALAVNTAEADLRPLDTETLLIGQDRVKGHGVGADNELGAEIMQADSVQVMNALDGVVDPQTEAIFIVAGLGGGTGSGGAPVLARELSRVYDAPVYGLGVLPGQDEGSIYQVNAGRSLKTLVRETDALLLVDNDAWRAAGESMEEGYDAINEKIARRVGLLLGAGEATEGVGESVVDTSEVINTLRVGGLAVLGYAAADASPDAGENVNVVTSTARKALLTGTSVPETTTAEAALVVVAGDPERLSRKGVERARRWIEGETGSMQVRGGDYPVESDQIGVLVLLAGVGDSPRLDALMDRARNATSATEEESTDPAAAFQNDDLDDLF